jgi:hypothetical protein
LGGWLEKSEGVIFSSKYGNFPTDVDTYFGADWGWSDHFNRSSY